MKSATAGMLVLCALFGMANAAQAQATRPQEEVRAVVEAYAAALAAGDSLQALALLHPDAVIHENGHAETREQYRSGHLRSDIAFAAATQRTILAENVRAMGDAALYTSRYRVSGRFRDRDIDSRGTETMVLQRVQDGWRIVHIHWSSR